MMAAWQRFPSLSVTMSDIFLIPMMISGLVILATTVLPVTPPFHVAVFSFLVFVGYMHLEILIQWETTYFSCCLFKMAGEVLGKMLFASWYCGFPILQKTSVFFAAP